MTETFDFQPRTRVLFGAGVLSRLGEVARSLGFARTLLVADRGLVATGHVARAASSLREAGVEVFEFHDFESSPDSRAVEAGRVFAAPLRVDSIVGLGGGSSLDFAKGVNFLLTSGGRVQDFWGYGKTTRPMLPMLGVPTTSGAGSEAQSYALISDAETHQKMACGDAGAAFRAVILDPELTLTCPPHVTATAGLDAVAHAVETFVSTKRTPLSEVFSREAWRLLEGSYERVLDAPRDLEARAAMQLGAYFAGAAIENSMLGAAHACANPLTARYGTEHGEAVALMLPSVVRWNARAAGARYAELLRISNHGADARAERGDEAAESLGAGEALARRLERLIAAGGLPARLEVAGVSADDFAALAEDAGCQWTGRFNPRPFDAAAALELYESAY
ncbi:MAG TPA: iron-containing alcohol dehydrogenase [Pyrinomonadaceae bacterium]|nr:iron-containing alcohol dehydrogenase [Pyrinomonadaceae bacterium]